MAKKRSRPMHFYDIDDPQGALGCVVKCRRAIGATGKLWNVRWSTDIKRVTCGVCLKRQHVRLTVKRRKRPEQPMNAGMGMSGIQMGN